jgi:hypothetical protein
MWLSALHQSMSGGPRSFPLSRRVRRESAAPFRPRWSCLRIGRCSPRSPGTPGEATGCGKPLLVSPRDGNPADHDVPYIRPNASPTRDAYDYRSGPPPECEFPGVVK